MKEKDKHTVLIVEDEPGIALLERAELEEAGFVVEVVECGKDALARLKEGGIDLLLLDYCLTDMTAGKIITALGEQIHILPVVIVTAYGDEQLAAKMLKSGAADYVIKDSGQNYIQRLPKIVSDQIERKLLEESLRESERRLKQAEQIANLGHWELNLVSNTLYWSDEIYRIFDLKPQEFKASYKAFLEKVHTDDRDFVDKAYTDSLKNKTAYDIVHRLLMKDGTIKYVNEKCKTEYDENGKPLRSLGTMQDITKDKQVIEDLELFKYLLNQSNDAIFVVNADTSCFLDFNEEACTSLGYERSELINMTVPDITSMSKQVYLRHFKEVKKSGHMVFEDVHIRKDSTTFPVEINVRVVPHGEKSYIIAVVRDIAERKLAEEQNRIILRTALDGFLLLDIQGQILEANDAYCKMTGYSRKKLLKMGISDVEVVEKPEETKKHILQIIKTGKDRFETKHRCKDDKIVDIEVSANYVNIKEGRFFSFIRDITDRKKAEELLQGQKKALEQKNIALSEILGQIEIEKKQMKDNVIANAENLLLPIIQKLRLKGISRKYVQLLRNNLQELTSSFGARLTEKGTKLTSREIEVCNMIKNGLTSKEIASLLNISLRTTEKHRINIRRKLGIINKDINLSSFLKTL